MKIAQVSATFSLIIGDEKLKKKYYKIIIKKLRILSKIVLRRISNMVFTMSQPFYSKKEQES